MNKSYGQVAYEAFGDCRGWKSITGYPLDSWEDLVLAKQYEWDQIGNAVVKEYEERKNNEMPEPTNPDQPNQL